MGYNAVYGFENMDSKTEFECKASKNDPASQSFLCQDELGNIHVKAEFRICDVCGADLKGKIGYLHASYMYCEKCEKIHRKNEKKYRINKRIQHKINKINKQGVKP